MVVIFVGISNYGIYLTTGKAPSLKALLPDLSFKTPSLDDLKPNFTEDTVYKWVDENGLTQYSSEPPPQQISAEVLELDQNTNVIKGLEIEQAEESKNPDTSLAVPEGTIYSPDNIKKIMDDAKNVQNLLDERYKNQQDALDGL